MEYFSPEEIDPAHPAELLACEEALFEQAESADHSGFLTFWESTTYFVVLGYGKHFREEVFEEACGDLRIPVLRRSSGGGTVLQGPGCWNFTLVLPIESATELETITGANRFIMQKTRDAIAPLVAGKVELQGHTDLTLDGLKFSGNAQRRKRRCLLFHGAFLLNFDLTLVSKVLRVPRQQPDYRQNRPHESFLTLCKVDPVKIKNALIETWNAKQNAAPKIQQEVAARMRDLVVSKYSRDDWNLRF